jgi:hypothetical protein
MATITPVSLWMLRLAFAAALAVSAGVCFFFIWGLVDGSVSSFNVNLWFTLLALVIAVPVVGWRLRSSGRPWPAIFVLSILALPGLLYAFFILLVVLTRPSWN